MNITITNPVTLETHGAYKYLNKQMISVRDFIEKHWKEIEAGFNLNPGELTILLRPLPRRRTAGRANINNTITLDISAPLRSVIRVLFHELTHIEQYHQKRLVKKWDFGRWWDKWMDGEWVKSKGFGQTDQHMAAYQAQPWEQEADARMITELERLEKLIGEIPMTVVVQ
jgi:hypothetical protein